MDSYCVPTGTGTAELVVKGSRFIGTVGRLPNVGVCKNNFRNVPENAVQDWAIMSLANTNPEQYFWKQA